MDSEQMVVEKWFTEESQFVAADDYSSGTKSELRRRAIHYIVYAMNKTGDENYEPVVAYFAMSYFDRFLSRNDIPILLENEEDNLYLLAFSCLSISWKMSHASFRVSRLLHDMGEAFCKSKINSMEFQILHALQWRMHAVTAFFFLDHLRKSRVFPRMTRRLKRRDVIRIVFHSQSDIRFTRFKPSIIATSSLHIATSFFNDIEFAFVLETLTSTNHIKKIQEDLLACTKELHSMIMKTRSMKGIGGRPPLPPQQPVRNPENGSDHITKAEFMIWRLEVCRWSNDGTGDDMIACLQRRRDERINTLLSSLRRTLENLQTTFCSYS